MYTSIHINTLLTCLIYSLSSCFKNHDLHKKTNNKFTTKLSTFYKTLKCYNKMSRKIPNKILYKDRSVLNGCYYTNDIFLKYIQLYTIASWFLR